jgi:hypothetical protein
MAFAMAAIISSVGWSSINQINNKQGVTDSLAGIF